MRRVGVYVFYDIDGKADRYVTYFLDDFVKHLEELVIVSNGRLLPETVETFQKYTTNIIQRDNAGFDTWAYKAGMDHFGWEKLSQYDEVVICNDSIFGPVDSFAPMFDEMEGRDVDFWGITRHYDSWSAAFHSDLGCVPEHIQSFFMSFRKKLVTSKLFQDYWNDLPEINGYDDAVGMYEISFTKTFSEYGFRYDTYVDTEDLREEAVHPLMTYPLLLVRDRKCPIFKKRLFFQEYEWYIENANGSEPSELIEYLQSETSYPVEYVFENLYRTRSQRKIHQAMHWNYLITEEHSESISGVHDTALVVYLRRQNEVSATVEDLCEAGEDLDVFLFYDEELGPSIDLAMRKKEDLGKRCTLKKRTPVKSLFEVLECVCSELTTELIKYTYVGYISSRKEHYAVSQSFLLGEFTRRLHHMVVSRDYIDGMKKCFEDNPTLGCLMTPPGHGKSDHIIFGASKDISERTSAIWIQAKEKAGVELNVSEHLRTSTIPFSGGWFRMDAFSKIKDQLPVIAEVLFSVFLPNEELVHMGDGVLYLLQALGYHYGFMYNPQMLPWELINFNYRTKEETDAFIKSIDLKE